MPIVVRLTPDGLYSAEATPPNGAAPWSSEGPMTRRQVLDVLRALGCHQTDIGDAFHDEDPDWIDRPQPDEPS